MGINPCFPDKSDHDFGIADVLSELVEFGIEKTVNNEIIDAVPVVGTVQAFAKIVSSHRAAVMQKQTERFLKELNAQTITQKELQRYRDRVENNPSFLQEEVGRVLFALSKSYDAEKATMLARIYGAYVKEVIRWDDCQELIEIVSRLFVGDLPILQEVAKGKAKETTIETQHIAERLSGLGILSLRLKPMTTYPGSISPEDEQIIEITSIGKKFIQCIGL